VGGPVCFVVFSTLPTAFSLTVAVCLQEVSGPFWYAGSNNPGLLFQDPRPTRFKLRLAHRCVFPSYQAFLFAQLFSVGWKSIVPDR
jgi:hypothetical protein